MSEKMPVKAVKKPTGGFRAGAGRKAGGKNHATIFKERMGEIAREMVKERVIKDLMPLIEAQIANATGIKHFIKRNPKNGNFDRITDPVQITKAMNEGEEGVDYIIFSKDPSTQAFTALMDRAIGKPAEQVQLSGNEGGPIQVKWIGEK